MSTHLLTLRDWLRFAVSRFSASKLSFGHGVQNAYDEAVWLMLGALKLPVDTLEPFLDARLLPEEQAHLAALIEQRVTARIPTAYLLKSAWLQGLCFYVDERVIIPRSFIAELIVDGLKPWVMDDSHIRHVADMCTGSGCLAVLLAKVFTEAQVDALDISTDALAVAAINIREHDLGQRITCVESDLFGALDGKRYDLIICNPPYVDATTMATLPAEYRYEPALALASGEDGLEHVQRLLHTAAQYLNDEGLLLVEIGHNRAALETAFPHLPFTWLEVAAGMDYVFLLRKADLLDGDLLQK